MPKYKVVVKVTRVKSNTKKTKTVVVTGILDTETKTVNKAELINNEAVWTNDNVIASATLNLEQKSDILVKVETEKGKLIGEATLDVSSYASQVEAGARKKFEIKQLLTTKASTTVGLCLSITSQIERVNEEKQPKKNNSKQKYPTTPLTCSVKEVGRRQDRPRSASKPATPKFTRTPEIPDSGRSSPTKRCLSQDDSGDLSRVKLNLTKTPLQSQPGLQKAGSLSNRERSGSLLGRTVQRNSGRMWFSDSAYNSESEDGKETPVRLTHKSLTESGDQVHPSTFSIDTETKTSPSPTASLSNSNRLVQRTGSPFVTKGLTGHSRSIDANTSDVGSPSKSSSARKLPQNRRTHSDMTGGGNDINISLLKQEYKNRKAEAAEKYLVDGVIMMETPEDLHVVAYIIWKSLIRWDAFTQNGGLHLRIATECERAVRGFANSRKMLVHWLSTTLSLLCMTEEELTQPHDISEEEPLIEFRNQMCKLATNTFESVLNLLQTRLGPVLQAVLDEVLSVSSPSIGDGMPPSLAHLFGLLSDYMDCMQLIIDDVKKQFFLRVIHYLNVSVIDGLTQQGGSYSQGLQLKLLITNIEEWTRDKMGPSYVTLVNSEMEPLRQTANVLSLHQKTDLANETFLKTVCPCLRPNLVANLLAAYRPDHFVTETVSPELIKHVQDQEATYEDHSETFHPQLQKQLHFSFKMEALQLDNIALPKVVLDQPAFSFLKPDKGQSDNVLSW